MSVYWKLTVAEPAGMVSGECGVKAPLEDVVLTFTASAPVASIRLPKASSRAIVIVPEATPAVSVCGAVVKTTSLVAAGLTVSCCVAEPIPPTVAVIVGVPAAVSV